MEHSRSSWEWDNEPGQQQVRVGTCLGTHTSMSPRNGSCSSQHEKDTSSERFQPSSPRCKQLHGLCCKHCKPAQGEGPGQHVAVCLALVVTSEWHTHTRTRTNRRAVPVHFFPLCSSTNWIILKQNFDIHFKKLDNFFKIPTNLFIWDVQLVKHKEFN